MADAALERAVQAALDWLVADGGEVGLQAVVIKDGAVVVDGWSARTARRCADIDTGVAVALMRNLFSPDFTAIARLDETVADAYPSPAHREHRRCR